MSIIGVYKITNNINGHSYIGCSKDCEKRWSDHKTKSVNGKKKDELNKPLYLAIKKYGLSNFSFKIIGTCQENELAEKEIYWIKYYNTYENREHYNLTPGGNLPGKNNIHIGEKHGMAKLSEAEVIQCRKWYAEGKRANKIWEEHFKNKILNSGFQRMWHGKTWKHVMPEVFENNPHPKTKCTKQMADDIQTMYDNGVQLCKIQKKYKGILSKTTVHDVAKKVRIYN